MGEVRPIYRFRSVDGFKGCKVPQAQLLNYLEIIGGDKIGMDCSIMPTKFPNIFQISTTDFFYPLVDVFMTSGFVLCDLHNRPGPLHSRPDRLCKRAERYVQLCRCRLRFHADVTWLVRNTCYLCL